MIKKTNKYFKRKKEERTEERIIMVTLKYNMYSNLNYV